MLTPEEIKAYIADPIPKCPYCRRLDISAGWVDINEDNAHQMITCQTCGKRWLDLYKLIGIEEEDDRSSREIRSR